MNIRRATYLSDFIIIIYIELFCLSQTFQLAIFNKGRCITLWVVMKAVGGKPQAREQV
jgi:hypothetical protein